MAHIRGDRMKPKQNFDPFPIDFLFEKIDFFIVSNCQVAEIAVSL